MGSELVISPLSQDKKAISISEVFWEAYPAYLTMGMSYDEYWNGDARACRAYRKKRDEEIKINDEAMWRQGLYVYHALCCVAPYFNSIRPQKPEEYIKPFTYKESEEEAAEREREQMQKGIAYMKAWADKVNAKRKETNG